MACLRASPIERFGLRLAIKLFRKSNRRITRIEPTSKLQSPQVAGPKLEVAKFDEHAHLFRDKETARYSLSEDTVCAKFERRESPPERPQSLISVDTLLRTIHQTCWSLSVWSSSRQKGNQHTKRKHSRWVVVADAPHIIFLLLLCPDSTLV